MTNSKLPPKVLAQEEGRGHQSYSGKSRGDISEVGVRLPPCYREAERLQAVGAAAAGNSRVRTPVSVSEALRSFTGAPSDGPI